TSAMVTTALGFTPYNSTNPSGYITATGSITGSSGSCTGNAATATRWATGRTITLTGDVTGTSAAFDGSAALSFAATLANSGVTAGTYLKVTVDAKGRVTAGSSMTSGDVTSALGYTPANKAGDSFTGSISVSGSITATGDITAYSDARLKTDIETITGALDRVRKLRGVTFSRRDTGNRGVGLIAQELAAIVPAAVMTHEDGLLSVAYGNLVGVLIEAVKDLADKVDRLEAQP
ncbi:MAG: tail fiber domain-containing protein, partial [Betaproteobacteria bacterium]|nr:tail fiber domain-containing protein [Betaproteobacteria bacterium]